MKRFSLGLGVLIVLGMVPAIHADVWDYMLNINGTTYCEFQTGFSCGTTLSSGQTLSNVPGVSSTIDEANPGGSGLGTATVTFNPGAPGPYYVNLLLFEELLDADGDNEYGATGGTLAANQAGLSWQIDVPDYDYLNLPGDPNDPNAVGTIGANTAANTLANTNYVASPSTDFVAMALGFNFNLSSGNEEILTFTASAAPPSNAFYLEQINPSDTVNTGAPLTLYYSATATQVPVGTPPPPPPVPEPGSILLLGTAGGLLFWVFRARSAAVNVK